MITQRCITRNGGWTDSMRICCWKKIFFIMQHWLTTLFGYALLHVHEKCHIYNEQVHVSTFNDGMLDNPFLGLFPGFLFFAQRLNVSSLWRTQLELSSLFSERFYLVVDSCSLIFLEMFYSNFVLHNYIHIVWTFHRTWTDWRHRGIYFL